MKVLQVNCVYPVGSTGKIVEAIHNRLLQENIESVVCYGRGQQLNATNVYKTCGELYAKAHNGLSRLTGVMYGGCFFSTNKLISRIKKEQPDIVHLHCINGFFVNIYRLVEWLKKQRIKTVLTLHAEFMHTGGCSHALDCEKWKTGCGNCPRLRKETGSLIFDRTHYMWKKMKKAFGGFGEDLTVVSVSDWLKDRAESSPILNGFDHRVIFNGLDTEVFHPYDTEELKRSHGITSEKIVFHATPMLSNDPEHIKGGHYLLKLAEMMKGEPVRFFVAGKFDPQLQVPDNVVLLGKITDQKLLAQYYAMADVTVLTSKKETFSMVTAESLCCGTPVVGFCAGAPERITIEEYSDFSEFGDVQTLYSNVQKWLNNNQLIDTAAEKYSKGTMTEQYLHLYEQVRRNWQV